MASTRASISKASKRSKINIIPPKQLFMDLTQDDTKTPSPKLPILSPSAPNAPSKTPSTKDTSSSSIDYIPKSPTSSTSLSPSDYLNPPTSPPPRVSPPPPNQENASIDITLTLSPMTPLDVKFDTPSLSPPIIGHPIPWNLLEAHGTAACEDSFSNPICGLSCVTVVISCCRKKSLKEVAEVVKSVIHSSELCIRRIGEYGYAGLGIDHYAFLVLSWRRYAVSSLLDTAYSSSFQNSANIFVLVPELRLFASSSQVTPELLHLSTLKQLSTKSCNNYIKVGKIDGINDSKI
ncbi:hypothetical protein Tco_1293127 [Tanacetum coccineum]